MSEPAAAAPSGVARVPAGDVHGWSLAHADPLPPLDAAVCQRELEDGTYLAAIVHAVGARHEGADLAPIRQAFDLAMGAHATQRRRSGEPYLIHPVRVALTLAHMGLDVPTVAAALLHDTVEDSEISVYHLTESLGREVAAIVDGVTKLGKIPYLSRKEQQAESFRKMLLAMAKDIRVLLVKLADRLDNMRTLEHMPPEKRERISRETQEIHAPLAHRLGLEDVRRELEDLSFRYLQPASWSSWVEQLRALAPDIEDKAARARELLEQAFVAGRSHAEAGPEAGAEVDDAGWDTEIFGPVEVRVTRRWPQQLQRIAQITGRRPERPEEMFTLQVVVRDRTAAYAALGVLHGRLKPVPGTFRDYVALVRPNGYRALHTVVLDGAGARLEVQVLSHRMDAIARRGIVAQWAAEARGGPRPAWLGRLVDWQHDVHDPSEFIEAVKADLFADEVYVFTPEGDIHTFPKGATPIDFAYAIHTDVGAHCSGARVNGHVVPLRYRLRQGDTVEIITDPSTHPRAEWLKMCVTARARARVKHFLRQQERNRLRTLGESLLEQEFSSRGMSLAEHVARGTFLGRGRDLVEGASEPEDIYAAVGAGTVPAWEVFRAVCPAEDGEADGNLLARVLRRMAGRVGSGPRGAARVELGRANNPIRITRERVVGDETAGSTIVLAPCCSPVPGDPVVGFFRSGEGFVAHVQGCPEALDHLGEQRVYLAWEDGLELDCPVTLEVVTENTVGLLAKMSRAFSRHDVNIKQANCRTAPEVPGSEAHAVNTFHASVRNLPQLQALVQDLKEIEGVRQVDRVFTAGSGVFPR